MAENIIQIPVADQPQLRDLLTEVTHNQDLFFTHVLSGRDEELALRAIEALRGGSISANEFATLHPLLCLKDRRRHLPDRLRGLNFLAAAKRQINEVDEPVKTTTAPVNRIRVWR